MPHTADAAVALMFTTHAYALMFTAHAQAIMLMLMNEPNGDLVYTRLAAKLRNYATKAMRSQNNAAAKAMQ